MILPLQSRHGLLVVLAIVWVVLLPSSAFAQAPVSSGETPSQAAPAGAVVQSPDDDDESVLDPAEPDIVVVNLPTNLRLPRFKSNFRMTHRFAGDLRRGSFSENAGNLFGLDQGAIIGFEFRMNVARNLQAAIFRTNFDKTIQMHGKYDAVRQGRGLPISVSALVSIEGTDNFREKFAPAVGVVMSRKVGSRLALYAMPMWVGNTNASLDPINHEHDHGAEEHEEIVSSEPAHERRGTILFGLGGRARLTRSVYVVGEVTPRLDGYAPDEVEYGFGIEKRVGGHAFALTFTNTFGTTFAQLARGGTAGSLYLGFNLSRKFF
ncbi:MAG: hypothetical protein IT183_00650 [Acidobacteria bacterium]|nr:hypothetical protein [Acidobacteriota bacterium]